MTLSKVTYELTAGHYGRVSSCVIHTQLYRTNWPVSVLQGMFDLRIYNISVAFLPMNIMFKIVISTCYWNYSLCLYLSSQQLLEQTNCG